MGYESHRAIIVSCWQKSVIEKCHQEAVIRFSGSCAFVTEATKPTVNGWQSFMVAPDGSKEGWAESEQSDAAAVLFLEFLNGLRYEDGSSPVDWVYVRFADGHYKPEVLRASDTEPEDIRSREE